MYDCVKQIDLTKIPTERCGLTGETVAPNNVSVQCNCWGGPGCDVACNRCATMGQDIGYCISKANCDKCR